MHLRPHKLFFFWIYEANGVIWDLFHKDRSKLRFAPLYNVEIDFWPHKSETIGPMCVDLVLCQLSYPGEQVYMFLSEIEKF